MVPQNGDLSPQILYKKLKMRYSFQSTTVDFSLKSRTQFCVFYELTFSNSKQVNPFFISSGFGGEAVSIRCFIQTTHLPSFSQSMSLMKNSNVFGLSKERPILGDHPKTHIHEIWWISCEINRHSLPTALHKTEEFLLSYLIYKVFRWIS